jgi:hypothetical protein
MPGQRINHKGLYEKNNYRIIGIRVYGSPCDFGFENEQCRTDTGFPVEGAVFHPAHFIGRSLEIRHTPEKI